MLKSRYTYAVLGFIIFFIGLLNGGFDFDKTFPNALHADFLPREIADYFVAIGGLLYVLLFYIDIIDKNAEVDLRKQRKIAKYYEQRKHRQNQKKWREHYSKLKAKRGL